MRDNNKSSHASHEFLNLAVLTAFVFAVALLPRLF